MVLGNFVTASGLWERLVGAAPGDLQGVRNDGHLVLVGARPPRPHLAVHDPIGRPRRDAREVRTRGPWWPRRGRIIAMRAVAVVLMLVTADAVLAQGEFVRLRRKIRS